MRGGVLKEIKRKWMHFEPRVVGRLSLRGKRHYFAFQQLFITFSELGGGSKREKQLNNRPIHEP